MAISSRQLGGPLAVDLTANGGFLVAGRGHLRRRTDGEPTQRVPGRLAELMNEEPGEKGNGRQVGVVKQPVGIGGAIRPASLCDQVGGGGHGSDGSNYPLTV